TGSEMFHWHSFRGLKDSRRDQEGIARDSSWGLSGVAAAVKAKFTTVQTPLGASTLEGQGGGAVSIPPSPAPSLRPAVAEHASRRSEEERSEPRSRNHALRLAQLHRTALGATLYLSQPSRAWVQRVHGAGSPGRLPWKVKRFVSSSARNFRTAASRSTACRDSGVVPLTARCVTRAISPSRRSS